MEDLAGKVAVVNGSASGLDLAMARAFADEGMLVVVADRRLDMAEASAADIRGTGGKAEAIEVDVTDRASLDALADQVEARFGGAQLLVNNAGVLPLTPLLEAEENGWRFEIEVNVFGVLYGCQTFLPPHVAHRPGRPRRQHCLHRRSDVRRRDHPGQPRPRRRRRLPGGPAGQVRLHGLEVRRRRPHRGAERGARRNAGRCVGALPTRVSRRSPR